MFHFDRSRVASPRHPGTSPARRPIGSRSLGVVLAIAGLCAALPSAAIVVTLHPVKDNTIYQDNGTFSNGAGSWFIAGRNNDGTGYIRRALIQFDLSAIPSNATINAVTLTMVNDRGKSGTQTVSLYRATAAWGEGTSNSNADPGKGVAATTNDATWTHRLYPTNLWTTPGGDRVATVTASTGVGNSGTYNWTSAQMISDVQTWV